MLAQSRLIGLSVALLALISGGARAAEWESTTTDLIKKLKPGYGELSGVVVDHSNGDVYICVSDRGIHRSTDQAKTWKQVGKDFKGRTEWPGCMMIDPTGKSKRLVVATVYGAPIAVGSTDGSEWKFMNGKSNHVDWFALDWTDSEGKFILSLKHESGGLLIVSRDGGKTFADVGKGYGPAWVFDGTTAVVAQMKTKDRPEPALMRTTDRGKTFTSCGEHNAQALPKWRDKQLYWLTDRALISSGDKGVTWKKLGTIKNGRYGPIFGKDSKHLFVLTNSGIVESKDGGATFGKPIAVPKDLKGVGALTWMEYDPVNDVLYVMSMRSQLYKLARK